MSTHTASVQRAPGDTAASVLERGACLGSYQLVLPIASGGMGRVWIAAKRGDFGFERMFAVKVMREDLAEKVSFRRMFLDEAKLSARLRHTNVVEVVDLGEACGTVYQAMALVDGDSLSGLRALVEEEADRQIPPEIAGRIVVDVLRGLHAAHQLRDETGTSLELVHRDVSPHNILVGLDGVSKIADFGVAKAVGSIGLDGPVGKRSYMAPEQLVGQPVDCRSDVFAAGVVLWELIVGQRSSRMGETLLRGRPIEHPCAVRPDAHPGLSEIAMRALALLPDDRFPSADAMADAIEQAAFQSGLVLSSKRVGAWVSELVGVRVSRQREEARREFELSQVSVFSGEAETPQSTSHADARTLPMRDAGPTLTGAPPSSTPVPTARPPRRVPVVASVALVLVGTLFGATSWTSRNAASASKMPSSSSPPHTESDPVPVSLTESRSGPSSASLPLPVAVTPVTSSSAQSPVNQARSSVVRPRASSRPPTKSGAVPSLPYDNPYKR